METAGYLSTVLDIPSQVRIEAGLSTFRGRDVVVRPTWMTHTELTAAGFPIDTAYEPIVSAESLLSTASESSEEMVARISQTVRRIVAAHPQGTFVIIGGTKATLIGASVLLNRKISLATFEKRTLNLALPNSASLVVAKDVSAPSTTPARLLSAEKPALGRQGGRAAAQVLQPDFQHHLHPGDVPMRVSSHENKPFGIMPHGEINRQFVRLLL